MIDRLWPRFPRCRFKSLAPTQPTRHIYHQLTNLRDWLRPIVNKFRAKEDVRILKALAREQAETTVIARKLKRSVAAVYLRASKLDVMLGGGRGRKRV